MGEQYYVLDEQGLELLFATKEYSANSSSASIRLFCVNSSSAASLS